LRLGLENRCDQPINVLVRAGILDGRGETCKLHFRYMATTPTTIEDVLRDFQFPQREAAFFYGLFLRGHSPEKLRKDIEVPAAVLAKWDKETAREPQLKELLDQMILYRRHVLAIFDHLVGHESLPQRVQ
jgi:hypothetical protein